MTMERYVGCVAEPNGSTTVWFEGTDGVEYTVSVPSSVDEVEDYYRNGKAERRLAVFDAGRRVGRAIARDVIADGMPRQWTGLDPQDADQLSLAGIEPGTEDWARAEEAARAAYKEELEV